MAVRASQEGGYIDSEKTRWRHLAARKLDCIDTAFDAFVDVGVHRDGLVRISAMPTAYVKDSRKIAKPGDVVRVDVLEVDPKHRRISLTMRLDQAPEARRTIASAEIDPTGSETRLRPGETRAGSSNPGSASGDAMAEALGERG